MVQILDQLQDVLLCSQCHKYLSVLPVKVYQDGSVKCGRCCENDNDGGSWSLYTDLAKNYLFKCINRYEGCRKLLFPSDVVEHEATCNKGSYNCPQCNMSAQMSAYELIQHFKHNHANRFLTSNTFHLELSVELDQENFLYVQDDNIFFIRLKYIPRDLYLYISAISLRELENIEQQFIISANILPFHQTTTKEKCLSLNNFTSDHYFKLQVSRVFEQLVKFEIILNMLVKNTSIRCYEIQFPRQCHRLRQVELTPEFLNVYPQYNLTHSRTALYSIVENKRITFVCSNCNQLLSWAVFWCSLKKHLLCQDCQVWCSICDEPVKIIEKKVLQLCQYLLSPCKWCDKKYKFYDLRYHERYCYMNTRKCPLCKIITCDLGNHINTVHQCKFSYFFSLAMYLCNRNKDIEYFMKSDHIFKIECEKCASLLSPHLDDIHAISITSCDNIEGLELFAIVGSICRKIENGKIITSKKDKPELYIKYF